MIRTALRADIRTVDPANFRIEGARALIRVIGEGVGVLRCCDQRRVVTGRFEVELRVPVSTIPIEVVLYAVAGVRRRVVTLAPTHRLVLPSLPANTNARALVVPNFGNASTRRAREDLANALQRARVSLRRGPITCTSHIPRLAVDAHRLSPAPPTERK